VDGLRHKALLHCVVRSATEACDDDGLPHTLEHLVFLGSEDYPFKASFLQFIVISSFSCDVTVKTKTPKLILLC